MKKIFILISLYLNCALAGQIGERTVSGVVKSFDQKTVTIESQGQKLQFDINRVVNRKSLAVGKTAEISLENKK